MLSKKRSMSFAKRTLLSVSLSLVSGLSFAKMYELPEDGSRLIGRIENHVVQEGETMANIAKHYDVGMLALMAANKGVDPFLPQEGRVLTIPSQLILPEVPHQGIVINLAELRLYYFPEGEDVVHVFPVGIGRIGRDTPVMTTSISKNVRTQHGRHLRLFVQNTERKGWIYLRLCQQAPTTRLGCLHFV